MFYRDGPDSIKKHHAKLAAKQTSPHAPKPICDPYSSIPNNSLPLIAQFQRLQTDVEEQKIPLKSNSPPVVNQSITDYCCLCCDPIFPKDNLHIEMNCGHLAHTCCIYDREESKGFKHEKCNLCDAEIKGVDRENAYTKLTSR